MVHKWDVYILSKKKNWDVYCTIEVFSIHWSISSTFESSEIWFIGGKKLCIILIVVNVG